MSDNTVVSRLAEINLQLYEEQIVTEQGYDDVDVLQSMSETELAELADECKMKPGHKKKFIAAFNVIKVTSDVPVGVAVEKQASSGKLRKQSTTSDAKAKALKEVEEIKKQMEAEKAIAEKEAMARKYSKDQREMQHKFDLQMAEMKAATQAAGAEGKLAAAQALAEARVGQQQAAMPIVINNNNNNNNSNSTSLSEKSAEEIEAEETKRAEEDAAKLAELEENAAAEEKAFEDADLDPNLREVQKSFQELDESNWQLLNSITLRAKLTPQQQKLQIATEIYQKLNGRAVLVRPAFGKIAEGTSNTGKPKSPIEKKNHPWNNDSHQVAKAQIKSLPSNHPTFCYDHPGILQELLDYPYFKQQPEYATLLEQMTLDYKTLNKAGRQLAATNLINAATEAQTRFMQRENLVATELEGTYRKWMIQVAKMIEEEKTPDGCPCVVS